MTQVIYPKFKEYALGVVLGGATPIAAPAVKALLVDSADYTYDAAHEFLSDVPLAARVAASGALTSKTFTNGVFDAADPTFSSVSGDISEAIIFFIDTGDAATSRLITYENTGISGAPVTPNGLDINLALDDGANKIFAL